ncbi:hypothetical protein HQ529_05470 [Candidatus Woesearchaeota archaeon]|nr:hypothetical protein [Candidatus Woesearchaeota archaeon]
MIHLSTILQHYKKREIQEEILKNARNKEVAVKFGDKGFGKRPDVLEYPQDVLEFAKKGVTSFHASEELWENPLRLSPEMKRKEMEELRTGWDLVLDIDCYDLEYSKQAAYLIIEVLKFYGVKSISCKFSGNKGFHVGVPFETFPEKIGGKEIKELFPEAPRRIAILIKDLIKEPLGKRIIEYEIKNGVDPKDVFTVIVNKLKKAGLSIKEENIIYIKEDEYGMKRELLNVEPFLGIDTILISSRHLCRMVYSFNEKSKLISVPINPEKVLEFKRENAEHPVEVSKYRFLDRTKVEKGEAKKLIIQSYDHKPETEENIKIEKKEYELPNSPLPVEHFPPCMKLGLNGLSDGRKRFLFVVTNFLVTVGWDYDNIDILLREWNKKNDDPLRETYLVGHLRYHKSNKKKILPPNCDNMMYYVDMRICKPDNLCRMIKNPVSYTRRKTQYLNEEKSPKKNPPKPK